MKIINKFKSGKSFQILHRGEIMEGYYIDYDSNFSDPNKLDYEISMLCSVKIWSYKGTGVKELSMPISGKAQYPKVVFRVRGEKYSVHIHRVIAENLIPFPKPKNITKQDWDATPETVKSVIKHSYRVNHIDHNKYHWHPSNLEWVTAQENSQKAVQFYKGVE